MVESLLIAGLTSRAFKQIEVTSYWIFHGLSWGINVPRITKIGLRTETCSALNWNPNKLLVLSRLHNLNAHIFHVRIIYNLICCAVKLYKAKRKFIFSAVYWLFTYSRSFIKKNLPKNNCQLTFLLLLILSNCLCVHSPILWDPQSSSPTRAYVNVIEPMGRKYVRNIKTTLYLQQEEEKKTSVIKVLCDYKHITHKRRSKNVA